MNTRILSVAALTGMLAATGCGGGSGPGAVTPTTGLAPTIGGGVGASSSKRSLSISFRIPTPAALQTSSASRHPEYVSPGTTGVNVFLSTAYAPAVSGTASSANTTLFTTAAATALNNASPTEILTNFVPTSLAGSFSLSGTAIATLTGSSSAVTAPYSIVLAGSYSVLTITIPNVVGDVTNSTTAVTSHEYVRIGAVFTDSSGYVLSEGQAPTTANHGGDSGTAAYNPAATDANSIENYQIANAGPTQVPLILSPVPATVYLFGSTGVLGALGPPVSPSQAAQTNVNVSANSYEVTAYLADHAGYVIPAQEVSFNSGLLPSTVSNIITTTSIAVFSGSPAVGVLGFDAGATVDFTTSKSSLVTVQGSAGLATAGPNTNVTSAAGVPSIGLDPITLSTQATFSTVGSAPYTTGTFATPGYLVYNVALPSGTAGYGQYAAGYAINATVLTTAAAASGVSATLYGVLNESHLNALGTFGPAPTFGQVSGFAYTASNYPSGSTNYLGTPGSPATAASVTIPLSPSVVPIIQ